MLQKMCKYVRGIKIRSVQKWEYPSREKIIFKVFFWILLKMHSDIYIFSGGKLDKDNLVQFMKDLKKNQPDLTDEEAAQIAASKIADSKPKSRMYYKIGASREMAGGKKIDPKARMSDKLKGMYDSVNDTKKSAPLEMEANSDKTIVEFQSPTLAVLEDAGKFCVTIVRYGLVEGELTVKVDTQDGSAKAGEDYIAVHKTITFKLDEKEAEGQAKL